MDFKYQFHFLFFLLWVLTGCSTVDKEIKEFKNKEDIRQARIGIKLGTLYDPLVTKEFPEAEIVRVETDPDLFLALQQGKCDVIFTDYLIFVNTQSQYPEMVEVAYDFPPDFYGMAFQLNNSTLQVQFNDYLKEIRGNGLYQEIYDRWIHHGKKSVMPTLKEHAGREPLRVAIAATQYPFAFIKEQEIVGFDVEIILRFAQKLQRPVEFQNVNFGSLIASLQAGKSDIIAGAISITEERGKMVLFSDSYFETRSAVVTISQAAKQAIANKDLWQSIKESFIKNLLAEKRYMLILEGLKITLIISIFSILLGTLLGGIICFMRMHKNSWLRSIASTYILIIQGIPLLVLLMLMFYVFLADFTITGVYVAVVTFAINFSAFVSEMFRTSIQSVDRGQTEAGIALGFTPTQTFFHIIMPQATKNALPLYKGEMITLIKMTSIVGYIAVEDLTKMTDIIRSQTFDAFFPLIVAALLYFILAWIFGKAIDLLNPKQQPES